LGEQLAADCLLNRQDVFLPQAVALHAPCIDALDEALRVACGPRHEEEVRCPALRPTPMVSRAERAAKLRLPAVQLAHRHRGLAVADTAEPLADLLHSGDAVLLGTLGTQGFEKGLRAQGWARHACVMVAWCSR